MADNIRATPRNEFLGLLADAMYGGLEYMKDPRRTQQMQGLAGLLESTGIPKTTERMAYGEDLTNINRANVPMLKPETAEAMMTVAPMVGPAGRLAEQTAMKVGRAGERLAERVVPQVMERGGMGAGLLSDMAQGTRSPLDVYHGTPHTLPPTERNPLGEFDASKIGTGEGAQTFGYGIYTAENPAVATSYKLAGVDTVNLMGRDGGSINISALPKPLQKAIEANVGAPDLLGNAERFLANKTNQSFYSEKYGAQSIDDSVKALKDLNAAGVSVRDSGNLYKVDLPDEKIANMLDWDKPMAEQRNLIEKMRKALVGGDSPLSRVKQFELNDFLNDKVRMRNLSPQSIINLKDPKIVERLRQAGIPGVKYFDELSRRPGASSMTQAQLDTRIDILKKDIDSGLGNQDRMKEILSALEQERAYHSNLTRNFVVFPGEEKSMTILERNSTSSLLD